MAKTVEDQGSVTRILGAIQGNGDREDLDLAAEALWNRYSKPLVRLATRHLRELHRTQPGLNSPEDVALSAFFDFCKRAASDEGFDRLVDRNDLWKLLRVITSRKAAREYRDKYPAINPDFDPDWRPSKEPRPELAAMTAEAMRRLLAALPDETHRTVALKKFERYTNKDIADLLGRSTKNVEYKLRNIRAIWLAILVDGPTEEPNI